MSNLKKINYLISQKKFSEVELIITKLLLEDSRNQELLLLLGGCYRSLGKLDKAKETYFKIIQINPTNTVSQRLIIDYLSNKELIQHRKNLLNLSRLNLEDSKKVELFFGLGILNERLADYKNSSDYFSQANDLKRKLNPFNFDILESHFKDLVKVFSEISFDSNNFFNQKKIIFIVGLPRSGTSLVEAILGANNKIYNAGEIPNLKKIIRDNFITNANLDIKKIFQAKKNKDNKIYNNYINLGSLESTVEKIITDKNTENFKFLGLINIFFNNAKIINCIRDPFENYCSIYKTNFNSKALNWTNSKKEIKLYANYYFELIKFWKSKKLTNIYDLNFEELLAKPYVTITKLITFCELEDNFNYKNFFKSKVSPVKTASANQVRGPIKKENINKYKKFKNYFDFI